MLSIEHLKRRAEQYLRLHRDQYYPVAARIRSVLPRYCEMSVREVLNVEFRLSDAQELIARSMGFESWDALRRGSRYVTHQPRALPMTALDHAQPRLFVRDVPESCEFYSKMLGFGVPFMYGEPPFYAQAFRDSARLNRRHVDGPVIDPGRRDAQQLRSLDQPQ